MSSDKKAAGKPARGVFHDRELSLLCSQFAMILRAGISLYDGMESMSEDMSEGDDKERILLGIKSKLQEGASLYEAFQSAGVFPDYMVNMVDIGERSGRLEDVMASLSVYYDREDRLKQEIRSAVIYPALLVFMMAAVILVLIIRVLPVFETVFKNLGVEMSGFSKGLMDFGIVISQYAIVIVAVLALLVVGLFLYSRLKKGSGLWSGLLTKLPGLRKLTEKISAGRFASALSLLLSSGYDTRAALDLIPNILTGSEMKEKAEKIKSLLDGGMTLSDAIKEVGIFPGLYARMISVGFKTGTLDEVMKELSGIYEEEINTSLNNFVAVLEPALVAALSIVIGVIIISVMLPLMGIMSSIG